MLIEHQLAECLLIIQHPSKIPWMLSADLPCGRFCAQGAGGCAAVWSRHSGDGAGECAVVRPVAWRRSAAARLSLHVNRASAMQRVERRQSGLGGCDKMTPYAYTRSDALLAIERLPCLLIQENG